MPDPRRQKMEALRDQIAALERHPVLAGFAADAPVTAEGLALRPGMVEELFAPDRREAGAALGFALGQLRPLLSPARPAIVYLQLVADAREDGLPYGPGLAAFGIDPGALVIGRIDTVLDLLWAAEEAVGCRAVAGVVADVPGTHKALDFTASRRLSLRAAATGVALVMLRYGPGREASAAQMRLGLSSAPSPEALYDPRAPGRPRFRIDVEKAPAGLAASGQGTVFLEWTGNGFAADQGQGFRPPAGPALPGAPSPLLGDRLAETA